MQNKCNNWMKYIKVLPHTKKANMRSSTVHLHAVDLIDMKFNIDYKNINLYYIKRINT